MDSFQTYFKEINDNETIDSIEQSVLAEKAQKGDILSRDRLIRANLKFVVSLAKQYQGQGVPLEDLISEGNLGIIKAIEKFDDKFGNKFLTYASWWIRQSILQALSEQNRIVRQPANRIGILQQMNKTSRVMQQDLQRDVTENEVLAEMEVDHSDVYKQTSFSYDLPTEDGGSLLDGIENSNAEQPDASLMVESLKIELTDALEKISKRGAGILKMYYGIGYERQYTLEEIGEQLDLTRERIRQLKTKALKDLRRLQRRKKLGDLQDN